MGIGFCNITKCCTEVCPEDIHITDNAIIPLKERVVDASYDPIAWLGRKIMGRPSRPAASRPASTRVRRMPNRAPAVRMQSPLARRRAGATVPELFSDEWFEALAAALEALRAWSERAAAGGGLALGQIVTGVPEDAGAADVHHGEVRYTIVLRPGAPPSLVRGSTEPADVVLVEDWSTAEAIASGAALGAGSADRRTDQGARRLTRTGLGGRSARSLRARPGRRARGRASFLVSGEGGMMVDRPYPKARRSDQADVYHGELVPDPYRWLEQSDDPETLTWIRAENELTEAFLAAVPNRDEIRSRLTELSNYPSFGVPFRRGGLWFQTRNSGLQDQPVLWVMDDPGSQGRVLLDPNLLSEDGTVAVTGLTVTEDGAKLAYATSGGIGLEDLAGPGGGDRRGPRRHR